MDRHYHSFAPVKGSETNVASKKMEDDADRPLPSIEFPAVDGKEQRRIRVSTGRMSDTVRNVPPRSSPSRQSAPSTPWRSTTSRSNTPSASRSPSAMSSRTVSNNRDRSVTPILSRKRSQQSLNVAAPQPQFRRTSSNLNPSTALKMKERPVMTPFTVAKEYLCRDLKAHPQTAKDCQTLVITHDSCYSHRYARPRSSKATLASIVERPERIHATLLGASTAYVRLGARHKEGQHAPHPERVPAAPPFAVRKSTRKIPLNHPCVTAVHGTKWMDELQVMMDSAGAKLAMGQKELSRPTGHQYGKNERGEPLPSLHPGDLYIANESLDALQGCLGGVADAVDAVFTSSPSTGKSQISMNGSIAPDTGQNHDRDRTSTKRAFVCIRPPGHHCSKDGPAGFCWLNNVHVGISYAAATHGLTHAAIIDFDLHHGDGSQEICWEHNQRRHNTPNSHHTHVKTASSLGTTKRTSLGGAAYDYKKVPIGYYSLHDINSYPCENGDEDKIRKASLCIHQAHGHSTWNVHLEPWRTLEEFWTVYHAKYKILLEKAKSFLRAESNRLRAIGVEPKGAVFLSAGFDANEHEMDGMQRHGVNVPTEFYARFTADVVDLAEKEGLGVDGRVISVLEGGYSDRALMSGVLSHISGLTRPTTINEESQTMSDLVVHTDEHESSWWSLHSLQSLEAVVAGNLPPPPPSLLDDNPHSYSSPTQASTSRMTNIAKERSSLSAQLERQMRLESLPPEPVPEVDWATAAYELSRLLIPEDRQTKSCTWEELNTESARIKKDRLSLDDSTAPSAESRKLRERTKAAAEPVKQRTTSSNRRITLASASELPDPSAVKETSIGSRTRRRSSAASMLLSNMQDLDESLADLRISSRADSMIGDIPPRPLGKPVASKTRVQPVQKTVVSTRSSPRKAKAPAPLPSTTSSLTDVSASAMRSTGSVPKTSKRTTTQSLSRTNSRPQSVSAGSDSKASTPQPQSQSQAQLRVARNTSLTSGTAPATNTTSSSTVAPKKISIKLKMPSHDQHESNQRAQAAALSSAPTSASTLKDEQVKGDRKALVPKASILKSSKPSITPKALEVPSTAVESAASIATESARSVANTTQIKPYTTADRFADEVTRPGQDIKIETDEPSNIASEAAEIEKQTSAQTQSHTDGRQLQAHVNGANIPGNNTVSASSDGKSLPEPTASALPDSSTSDANMKITPNTNVGLTPAAQQGSSYIPSMQLKQEHERVCYPTLDRLDSANS